MTARQIALVVAFALVAAAGSAHAHGEDQIIRPLVVIAVLCGGVSGAVTALLRRSEGFGLGIAFGVLGFIALMYLIYSSFIEHVSLGLFFGGLLMTALFVAFAGAIPLAIVFLASYRLTAYIRKEVRDDAKGDSSAP
jgi:hypothetical protein